MSVTILSIDTSLDIALVCLSINGKTVASRINTIQKEHAVFLHLAIKEILAEQKIELHQLDAIAVTEGPGSYTGLRVGMSAAKGLCYALNKPILSIGTLPMIAFADILSDKYKGSLFCPMIDARRMEVYTALYDAQINEILPPQAMILDGDSFSEQLEYASIIFSGNGSAKYKPLIFSPNAGFSEGSAYAQSLSYLSYKLFEEGNFSDLVALKPMYIKDPQT